MKEILHDKCIPAAVSYYFSASQVGLKWSHSKTANIGQEKISSKTERQLRERRMCRARSGRTVCLAMALPGVLMKFSELFDGDLAWRSAEVREGPEALQLPG